jgi:cytochrome c oxidase cbb3-type subunit III
MRVWPLLLAALVLAGCQREERSFKPAPPTGETVERVALSPLSPGQHAPIADETEKGKEYDQNAFHMNNGKRLFDWFNCSGCHGGAGGGGSGPALSDDKWIYGSSIENIVATIREGRPNGMPSFRGLIPDDQIWEIASYIRSMGRYVAKDVAPGRNDDMNPRPAENRLPPGEPQSGSIPPGAMSPP